MLFLFAVTQAEPLAEGIAFRNLPPAEPLAPDPEPDDCTRAHDIVPGRPLPAELGTCRATAVPTWYVRDLIARAEWGRSYADWSAIQQAICTVERDAAREDRPRWYERPAVILPLGVALGAGAVLGGAWAVGQIADASNL